LTLSLRRARGGLWAAAGSIGSAGLGLASFLVLSRLLGPEAYGIIAMVNAALGVGNAVMRTGLAEALVQREDLLPEHTDSLFWTLQALAAALTLALILASGLFEQFFQQPGLGTPLAAASLGLILAALAAVPRALLARRFAFDAVASAELSAEAAGGAVGIGMAVSGFGVWSLVGQQLAARLVEAAVAWMRAGWMPRPRWSRERLRELASFSVNRAAISLLHFADAQVPRFILGRAFGAEVLGHFYFARRLLEATEVVVLSPVRALAMPSFARVQDDREAVRRAYLDGIGVSAGVTFPLFGLMFALAPWFIPLLFGTDWTPATVVVQIYALSSFRRVMSAWNSSVLRGLGRPEWLLRTSIVRSAAMLLLTLALLRWQAAGAAAALLLANVIAWPVGARFVQRLTGIRMLEQLGQGRAALAAALLMIAAAWGIGRALGSVETWPALAATALASLGVYASALWIFGRDEFRAVKALCLQTLAAADWRRAE
jgi:PST family polysaccharide transporter